ncbi:anaerobic sulfatase maturase [Vibrio sp. SM6]|uniref:Anaerobic sulfatase maturase n=2 Tax=Vibrio agarilyticus TaxID=2726741 RepID=A0A7X8TNL4_9VIBR|nr:anaerobic sulfatase maturase [Vibrio agarilyticus]
MAKPTSYVCNLHCDYCFYLEKEGIYGPPTQRSNLAMTDDVLRRFIKQYIQSQPTETVDFAWQGGEPTLAGIAFFEKVVAYQKQYSDGRLITNAFQTNGVLINDKWSEFLAKHNFLIGLSVDGTKELHDRYRVTKSGKGTFHRIVNAIESFKKYGVEFNTLTVVNSLNAEHPLEVYNTLKDLGSTYLQFIPIVESRVNVFSNPNLISQFTPAGDNIFPWTVTGEQYGKFMTAIFDEWVRNDVGKTFVQLFDTTLASFAGYPASVCLFAKECGQAMVIEKNGDIYSCDHFVYPEFKLGNINDQSLSKLAITKQQTEFGKLKSNLSDACKKCEFLFACNGGCTKHRIVNTPESVPHNFLCDGYKHYFKHVAPYMQFMVNELRHRRPPANVMRYAKSSMLKQ